MRPETEREQRDAAETAEVASRDAVEDDTTFMVTVEVLIPGHLDPDDLASEIETAVENELAGPLDIFGEGDRDDLELDIGAVGSIDPALIDDGVRFRRLKNGEDGTASVITGGSAVLLWRDVGGWNARVRSSDPWTADRYNTAEEAILARDAIRDEEVRTVEPDAARKLVDAKTAVAHVALCNRGELERAAARLHGLDGSPDAEDAIGLHAILETLDDWHTASIEVMQDPNLTPKDVDALMVE